jgi:hypothetical protein
MTTDEKLDAALEAGWREFVRVGDELGWDTRLILEPRAKDAVVTAMWAAWKEVNR